MSVYNCDIVVGRQGMPAEQTLRVLRIFLSSPGDVGEERSIVRDLLDCELKYDPAFRGKISFEVISWDNPASPTPMTAQLKPQEAVNRFRGKPSDCHIVIVILWSRLGTHLVVDGKPYRSGTEYEYEEAVNAGSPPEILVYHRTEKVSIDLDDPELERKREQRQGVIAFLERFRNPDGSSRGGINEYTTPTDFKVLLEKNLREILHEQLAGEPVGPTAPATAATVVWERTPYPGLRAFRSDEAAIFFGRGRETDALIAELRKPNQRFTAVIGASGSGKSSLVYAGLLPRLAEGAIEGSADWRTLCFKPGAFGDNPFLAMAAAMESLLPADNRDEPIAIAQALAKAPDCISAYVDRALAGAPSSARLILIGDQAEELFSQATASYRGPFVDLLAEATSHPRMQVVLTMREDFLCQATSYPRLAALLQTGAFVLGAPGPVALADMIRRPAQLAGLTLDDGLADEILHDVGSEPGALPLVAFCLEALYRSSASTGHLSLKAYGDLGRLEGAIRQRAAELLSPLQESEGLDLEATLPKLFRLLAHVDAAGKVSRRRAFRGELTAEPLLERIAESLVQGRLLLADDPSRATVSLAHEVVLTAWPELGSWVQAHRAQLQRLDRAISSLESTDPLDRSYGVQALGEIGPVVPEVISRLIAALGDPSGEVRDNVIQAFAKIGRPAVAALITALGDADATVREGAAYALAAIEPPPVDAIGRLIATLGDDSASVRGAVASALYHCGPPPEAVPGLTLGLGDTENSSAGEALAKIGRPAVRPLIAALGDANEARRAGAARALRLMGRPAAEAVSALITALSDPSAWVRSEAAGALGPIGSTAAETVRVLIKALGDSDENVRSNAAVALGQIAPPQRRRRRR